MANLSDAGSERVEPETLDQIKREAKAVLERLSQYEEDESTGTACGADAEIMLVDQLRHLRHGDSTPTEFACVLLGTVESFLRQWQSVIDVVSMREARRHCFEDENNWHNFLYYTLEPALDVFLDTTRNSDHARVGVLARSIDILRQAFEGGEDATTELLELTSALVREIAGKERQPDVDKRIGELAERLGELATVLSAKP